MVVRLSKEGKLRNSRPCNNCLQMMIKYNIKKIIYSTDDEQIIVQRPKDMEQSHQSSGWNAYINRLK